MNNMTNDKNNEKVINIFVKHKKNFHVSGDEKVVRNEDGNYFICIKKDENGKYFDEKKLLENADKCFYLVKVMVKGSEYPYIYNYRVSGEMIEKFLAGYINQEKEGKIIEINTYYPEELA